MEYQVYINSLKECELFYLMGHANELNFTDWFEWLYINNKDIFNIIVNKLVGKKLNYYNFKREKDNIDILISAKDKEKEVNIMIENKIKSVLMPTQLERYSKKSIKNKLNSIGIVLSLTPPVFFNNEEYHCKVNNKEIKWIYKNYNELLEILEYSNFSSRNYREFKKVINCLIKITDYFKFDYSKTCLELENNEFVTKLKEVKLNTLYSKYFSSNLLMKIYSKLDINPKIISNDWENAKDKDLICFSACSAKSISGLCEFKYIFKQDNGKNIDLGIQIENNQFRFLIEGETKTVNKAKNLIKDTWFNFKEKKGNKIDFCKFEDKKKKTTLFYQYFKIENMKAECVIDKCVEYIKYLIKNRENIQKCLLQCKG